MSEGKRLMIRCPNTGYAVFTGIKLWPGAKASSTNSKLRCKACGEWHVFSTEDTFVEIVLERRL